MTWTYEEIKSDWIGDSRIAVSPEGIVDAFNRVDSVLGREWIDRSRGRSGTPTARGSVPTLPVVSMGQRLASLDGVHKAEHLIKGLRNKDQSSHAELTAIYLLRSLHTTFVELYPAVTVGTETKEPDFRIRQPDDGSWTYVEVTQPAESAAGKRVKEVLDQLSIPLELVKKSYALEIFFHREPTEKEVESITKIVLQVCKEDGVLKKEMPDSLGFLLLNHSRPTKVFLEDHPGEETGPRLGAVKWVSGPGEPNRHIVVRIPFVDDRAIHYLETKAEQLPVDAPGFIMVDISSVMSGFRSWENLLHRHLQLGLHTHVGGMCLFAGGLVPTLEGEAWLIKTKLVVNPQANLHLPLWILDAVTEAGARYERLIGP